MTSLPSPGRQIDIQQARTHIAVIAGDPDARVTIQTIDDIYVNGQKRADPALACVLHGIIDELAPALVRLQDRGAGVFLTVNATDLRGRLEENIVALRALFVDSDSGTVRDAPVPEPSLIVKTGRGEHRYWVLAPGEPLGCFTDAQRRLAFALGTDPRVKDLPRVMRLAGTWHQKGEPVLVEITGGGRRDDYVVADVLADLPEIPKTERKRVDWDPSDLSRRATEGSNLRKARAYVERIEGAVEGQGGNAATFRVACILTNDYALPDFDAMDVLREYNTRCSPPWDDDELCAILANAKRYAKEARGSKVRDNVYNFPKGDPAAFSGFRKPAYDMQWPAMGALPGSAAVPEMPLEMVPAAMREWVGDLAAVAHRPVESIATAAISALSALAGNRYWLRPLGGDYMVPTHLWALNIAPPGAKKTSILGDATQMLLDVEKGYADTYKPEVFANMAKRERIEAKIAKVKKSLAKDSEGVAESELTELREELENIPKGPRRLITQDATSEKLLDLVRENPAGIAVVRDEIVGVLEATTKKGQEGARTMYLQGADSNPYTQDRIGRGTIAVDRLTLTLVGAAQPGAIQPYVEEARGGRADGLLQRFQLTVWPGDRKTWTRPTGAVSKMAKARVSMLAAWVSWHIRDSKEPLVIEPHDDAREFFLAWRDKAELRLCVGGDLAQTSEAFRSHIAKHQRTMQALAAIFQLIEDADKNRKPQSVSLTNAELAARWCEFLEVHARRLYGEDTDPGSAPARRLASKIRDGQVTHGMPLREIARKDWGGLRGDDLSSAVATLESLNWVRTAEETTGGRPSKRILLHPDLTEEN
jgi:hypothetical protein